MSHSDKGYSELRYMLRRFLRRHTAVFGLACILFILFLAAFGPYISPYSPHKLDVANSFKPPSWDHPFGTDVFGRDVLTRCMYGAGTSVYISLLATGIGLLFSTVIGIVAGFSGGLVDSFIMRTMDVFWAFPPIIFASTLSATFGPDLTMICVVIGLCMAPGFSRIIRSSVLSVKEKDYIMAARASGLSSFHIMFRHILPNVIGPVIVLTTLRLGGVVMMEAALSFLGLGVGGINPSWGWDLTRGRQYLQTSPHLTFFPGLMITISVLGWSLVGDGLRDSMDPRLK